MLPGADGQPAEGIKRHVYEISKRLALREFEVINIQPSADGEFHVKQIENSYKLVDVPVSFSKSLPLGNLKQTVDLLIRYASYKEASHRFLSTIDDNSIIHTHGFYVFSQPRRSPKVKRLATFHGSVPLDMISKNQSVTKATLLNDVLKHIYQNNADKWTAISQRVRLLAANCYGINKSDIAVTPHGVDCNLFSKRTSKEEIDNINRKFKLDKPYKILFLGQLDRGKRPDILLRAFSLLRSKKRDLQLVIRSHWGNYYNQTLKLIKDLELQDMVRVINQPVYGSELRTLYQTSYAFINTFPSLTGYSTALLEAMASGIPPIISKGSNEDVVDKSTGIILKDLSPVSVANAISSLIENDKYAKKLGQNAMRKMLKEFDWDNVVVPKYASVYKELLEK